MAPHGCSLTCSSAGTARPLCCALASAQSVPLSSCGVNAKARGTTSPATASNSRFGWWPSCGRAEERGAVRVCIGTHTKPSRQTEPSQHHQQRQHCSASRLPQHIEYSTRCTCVKAQAILNSSWGLKSHTLSSASCAGAARGIGWLAQPSVQEAADVQVARKKYRLPGRLPDRGTGRQADPWATTDHNGPRPARPPWPE